MYEILPSPVAGKGLFATQVIDKGCRLGRYTGTFIGAFETYDESINHEHYLWVEQLDGTFHVVDVDTDMRFVNHSAKPNARIGDDGITLFASATISPGDEIFIHYGDAWD